MTEGQVEDVGARSQSLGEVGSGGIVLANHFGSGSSSDRCSCLTRPVADCHR